MKVIQARIDDELDKTLRRLKQGLGYSESEAIRQGLLILGRMLPTGRRRKIIGLGEFESGISDLATNKKHLDNFGK